MKIDEEGIIVTMFFTFINNHPVFFVNCMILIIVIAGYREFMINLSVDVAINKDNEVAEYTDVKPGYDLETIIKNVCVNSKKAIDDTICVLNFDELKKVERQLVKQRELISTEWELQVFQQ